MCIFSCFCYLEAFCPPLKMQTETFIYLFAQGLLKRAFILAQCQPRVHRWVLGIQRESEHELHICVAFNFSSIRSPLLLSFSLYPVFNDVLGESKE